MPHLVRVLESNGVHHSVAHGVVQLSRYVFLSIRTALSPLTPSELLIGFRLLSRKGRGLVGLGHGSARLCSISRVSFGDRTPGAHFTCRLRSAAGAEFGNERSGSGGSGRRGVPSCVVRRGCTRSAQGILNTSSPSMASTASTRRDATWSSCSPEEAVVAAVAAAEQLC